MGIECLAALTETLIAADRPSEHLVVRHPRLLTTAMIQRLHRVDRRPLHAGLVGYRSSTTYNRRS